MDHRAGEAEIDARGGPEFVDAPCLPTGRRLQDWLRAFPDDTRPLILEFGAGFNPPGVVRRPGEHLVRHFPRARVVRVNAAHPERAPPAPQTPTTCSAYPPPAGDADARRRSRRRAAAGRRGDR
ncbi:hypothetical protein [Streptomyces olivaceoviridis]|uniref:hypothetical protein n=1 Tax=Streptomyces olivaceoviridis TaxID=1921 RepID=UPI0036FE6677